MRRATSRSGLVPTTCALALLGGSCEQQKAVPLSQSVPAAIALVAVLVVVWAAAWRALNVLARRRGRDARRQHASGLDRVLGVASGLVVVGALGVFLLMDCQVASKYHRPITDVFSWRDTAVLTLAAGAAATVGGFPLARMARGLLRGEQWARIVVSALLVAASVWLMLLSNTGTRVTGVVGLCVAAATIREYADLRPTGDAR